MAKFRWVGSGQYARRAITGPVAFLAVIAQVMPALEARAQGVEGGAPDAETSSGWIVTIGATSLFSPQYEGSAKYGLSGLPSVSFRQPNEPEDFGAPDDSLDYTLFSTSNFKVGPVVNLRSGRSTSDDIRLAGLNNYPWTIEPGVFAEFWPVPEMLRTRVEVRHGVRGQDGFVADLSMDLVQQFGAFTLSCGPRLSLADNRTMQQEFGVSPLASFRNGLVPPFNARGGVKSIGYGIGLSYDWSEQWRTTVFHRYDRLVGDAGASPITTRFGSRDQLTFGLGLSYAFRLNAI
ncbi:MipA/OmpV family protein [Microvirga alba]|uniref:MipA/OmpV family protein n=1 Tax=Microvirga alba TaxID=2791025 RepID=A0A931FS59_9HYPH|nr:MipA/OmpV family protein [Microvirga alba]MBF9235268.1 MipA/OmpV family protein [Microvirga alba]